MRGEKYRAKIEKRSRRFASRVERASPPQLRLPAFAAHARETARRHRAFSAPHLPCRLVEARFDNREGLGQSAAQLGKVVRVLARTAIFEGGATGAP